jgi:hypothetical protein
MAEKIKYRPYSIRMDERTMKRLMEERKKSGLSWNMYLMELLADKKKKITTNTA